MPTFKTDNAKGLKTEKDVLKQLKKINKKFKFYQSKNEYSIMDFILTDGNKKYIAELKMRNNRLKSYATTLMPVNKLDFMIRKKKSRNYEGIFLFRFTNGLYFCKVSEIVEGKDYHIEDFLRNKRSDFNDVMKKYMYISWRCLKPISELTL